MRSVSSSGVLVHCINLSYPFPGKNLITASTEDKVNFLGLSVDSAGAAAGQWVLLVLGLVLLVTTIYMGYKDRKSKKSGMSSSTMALKSRGE